MHPFQRLSPLQEIENLPWQPCQQRPVAQPAAARLLREPALQPGNCHLEAAGNCPCVDLCPCRRDGLLWGWSAVGNSASQCSEDWSQLQDPHPSLHSSLLCLYLCPRRSRSLFHYHGLCPSHFGPFLFPLLQCLFAGPHRTGYLGSGRGQSSSIVSLPWTFLPRPRHPWCRPRPPRGRGRDERPRRRRNFGRRKSEVGDPTGS
mmetsp:Transcript_89897/g.110064  ORF Transcript_89897/g.110064 Transcript_89897/m.110064 type:complete len:203 (+) Transcript_89897:572-1180(+)